MVLVIRFCQFPLLLLLFLFFSFSLQVCHNLWSSSILMKIHKQAFFSSQIICEHRSLSISELKTVWWICGTKIIPLVQNCIHLATISRLLCAHFLRHDLPKSYLYFKNASQIQSSTDNLLVNSSLRSLSETQWTTQPCSFFSSPSLPCMFSFDSLSPYFLKEFLHSPAPY